MVISDETAQAFAKALIVHSGNRTRAAEACGYEPGIPARSAGSDLARNPKVLEHLQPLISLNLQSLTPKAIATLGKLLDHKSGYIRLEAAKDILDRNGVGTEAKPLQSQPFLIRINLGVTKAELNSSQMLEDTSLPSDTSRSRPGGRKSEKSEVTSTPAHDFSPEVISAGIIDVDEAAKPLPAENKTYRFELD